MGTLSATLGLLLCAGMMFLLAVVIVWFLRDLERRERKAPASGGDGIDGSLGLTSDGGGRKSVDAGSVSGDGGVFGDGGGNGGGGGD